MENDFIPGEANLRPRAGLEGWSDATYFFDDRIDLKAYFGVEGGTKTVAYAFTYFDAPRDQAAEMWLGSDEAMAVYLNGSRVYRYDGLRTFGDAELVKEKIPVQIQEGENTLLVKVYQDLSNFDFSLNICEPESDRNLDGDRVLGLKFSSRSKDMTAVAEQDGSVVPQGFELGANYPNPFNASTVIPYRVAVPDGRAIAARLEIINLQGQRVRTLMARRTWPGRHLSVWDGRDGAGRPLASGVYLCRLTAGGQTATRRLLLLR